MAEHIRWTDQILCALGGLLAGETSMTLLVGGQPLWPYFLLATAVGWAIGLPVVLSLQFGRDRRISWAKILITGLGLGPVVLALLIVATSFLQALLGFGLATFHFRGLWTGTEHLWPLASLVSLAALVVYTALLRRKRTDRQLVSRPTVNPQ